jgi:hypothetical protein
MSEVLLPTWIIPEEETQEWLDEGSVVFPAAFAPGITQRQSYGGLRLKMSRRHTVRGEEKAQLLSILNQTRGRYNALRTKVHFALRGSGFGSELLSNNTFANGTTGWTVGSEYSVAVSDRVARAARSAVTTSSRILGQTVSTAQFAPYAVRTMILAGRGTFSSIGPDITGHASSYGVSGYRVASGVVDGSTESMGFSDAANSGLVAGDYENVAWISAARCALADNGLNLLLQSDELDTTWIATRSSVDDQAAGTTAPDGTSTADSIIEDSTAASTHQVGQNVTVASAAADYAFSVSVKAGARTWCRIFMVESTGTTSVDAFFNLSTGVVGTTATGANWSNLRTFSRSLGNGWHVLTIVARKTSAATVVSANIGLATADNTASYSGDGTSNIYAWRATLAQSSVPTRLVQTTSAASTGTSQTGNALHLKGLPASTSGLLLPGDYFEINGEIKQATAALNSDAAQLGYLQFEPALVRTPADNDPINALDPMGKFLVSNIKVDNRFGQHAVVTYDLEHIYE